MGRLRIGQNLGGGNPGDTVSVRLPNGEVVQAKAATAINKAKVLVATDEAGKHYAYAEGEGTAPVTTRQITRQRPRRKPADPDNDYFFKVLQADGLIEGFDDDIDLDLSGYTAIGITNTGDGYLVILQDGNSYIFQSENSFNNVILSANLFNANIIPFFFWSGGNLLRGLSEGAITSPLTNTNATYPDLVFFGWTWVHPLQMGATTTSQLIDLYFRGFFPGLTDINRRTDLGSFIYGVYDVYYDFQNGTEQRIFPELYNSTLSLPSPISIYSSRGTFYNTYGDNPVTPGNKSENISISINEIQDGQQWSYSISHSYSATHSYDLDDGLIRNATGSIDYNQSLNIDYLVNQSSVIENCITRNTGLEKIVGSYSKQGSITEQVVYTGEGESAKIDVFPYETGYIRSTSQTRQSILSGNIVEERSYDTDITTKGITKTLITTERIMSEMSKNATNITGATNGTPNSSNTLTGTANRKNTTEIKQHNIIIESEDAAIVQQIERDVFFELDIVNDFHTETTEDNGSFYNKLTLFFGANEYTLGQDYIGFYAYAEQVITGTTFTILPDDFDIGIDNEYWKNKTLVTRTVRTRPSALGTVSVASSTVINSECDLFAIEGVDVDIYINVAGNNIFYNGTLSTVDCDTENASYNNVTYQKYTRSSLSLTVGINTPLTAFPKNTLIDLFFDTSQDFVCIVPANDYTVLIINALKNSAIKKCSNLYTVLDDNGNETVELAVSQIPTGTAEQDEWYADIYRFNTTSLKWERRPNGVSTLSELTSPSDFISYREA